VLYRCYAKVNLTLEIVRKRDDGFHELTSLIHTINLADDLRIEPSDALLTRVEGLEIDPETNLIARASELMWSATGQRRGAELSLVKRIPAAAGLGGGSSDAATTLVGLNELWHCRFGVRDLEALAAQLGSDVPFFIRGGAALMRGRGDELEPLRPRHGQWLVLIVPPHDVTDKTRRLYGSLEANDFSSGEVTHRATARLNAGESLAQLEFVNGFERAARATFPDLADIWAGAERLSQRTFHLSGAGPALFALANDRADARAQVAKLKTLNVFAEAVMTVKHARASIEVAADTVSGYP
jgi:4-diphosphocytidyl-2-C-methyl-D-erythritol kinase